MPQPAPPSPRRATFACAVLSELRSLTADQQASDGSCLLRTASFIDDHARELGLSPLRDRDGTYVRS